MAQVTSLQSPDVVGQEDSTLQSTEQSPTPEKKSVFGKLKEKTKTKTNKLKHKLKPGSGGGGEDAAAEAEDTSSSSSSSEDEGEPKNAFTGMTQAEYERKLKAGEVPEETRDSALTSQFQGLSTEEKPSSQMDVEDAGVPKDTGGFEATPKDSILEKAGDPDAVDSDVAKDKPDPEGILSGKPPAAAAATKTWGQWVGEKVGLAKPTSPTAADSTTTTGAAAADKPMTEKIKESVVGAKDAVVGNVSEATGSAKAAAEENQAAAATTEPHKQTYTQKFTGAFYGAKDSLVSSTHPGDEDKALSQKVTETVSNLPTTIKSSLGLGGSKSASSSPTTTPRGLPTEEAEGALPQSPGIVSRITGSVTSLFGKKPHPDSSSSTSTTPTSEVPTSGTGTTETATPTPTL
ncbi:hypothetical protein R1flu_018364 [Riccia fluitans]|uniref:Uncharacterized protein n=1 Tax=Riccia fluitans TaxID=41844 RepID=A0ABD1ZFL9_9MARC